MLLPLLCESGSVAQMNESPQGFQGEYTELFTLTEVMDTQVYMCVLKYVYEKKEVEGKNSSLLTSP